MNLSKNFPLEEMLESQTAREMNITEQWTPPADVVENLRALCTNLLQPIRDDIGAVWISSGWRCVRLNVAIGGVPSSWHLTGMAADCSYYGEGGNQTIIDTVKRLGLPFDQMIDEHSKGRHWVHLSYSKDKNRYQMLRMIDGKYEIMT